MQCGAWKNRVVINHQKNTIMNSDFVFDVLKFYVTDPDGVADELLEHFHRNEGLILGIESVTMFTLAVQKPTTVSMLSGTNQPQVEYQFHYIVIYRRKREME